MARKWTYAARIEVDGFVHLLGRWRTRAEALLARDRAIQYFGVDRPLTYPKQARRLGPLSPEGLRKLVRDQVKATTASRFIGVYWKHRTSSWLALVRVDDRLVSVGVYADEEAAAEAVDQASRFLGLEPPNFPDRKLAARSPAQLRAKQRILRGTSKFFGLTSRAGAARPWFFQLHLPDGTYVEVGGYKTERIAALARDRAVLHYRAESPVNLPAKAKQLGPADIDTLRREVAATRKRLCTSKYRGVRWRSDRDRWTVYIRADKVLHFVGEFRKERDAAEAYDSAARRLLGPAAARRLNFP
jgi:hypothetical protein